jgi:hypothetical protein
MGASRREGRTARMTRRRRPGFTRGTRRCGRQLSPRPSDGSPTARRLPRTAAPATRRQQSPPYPAAAPASTTARPSASRRARQSPGECHSQRAGTPRIVRAAPSSVKGTRRSFLTASQKRSSGPALERRRTLPAQRPDGEGQAKSQAQGRAANLKADAESIQRLETPSPRQHTSIL